MFDFKAARRMMVDCQIRTSDITDSRIIAAMLELPRESFVPPDKAMLAYLDSEVLLAPATPGAPSRRLIKPVLLAKLLQVAEIAATDHVLMVGSATGYGAAVAATLAAHVVALEDEPALTRHAKTLLAPFGNVTMMAGPLADGWPPGAPYDVVVMEGATGVEPRNLARQLKEGGRLACVFGSGQPGSGMVYRWINGELSGRPVFDANAAVLPGFLQPAEFVF